ncbi:M3 family oligoendopeptidase [Prosthecobacter dejongeii]|uniref:Oligoendopeptidase F n=1 Tax=Prosthecobacter dejongeii TaxID=48465 RepID=A0A7W7YLZ6_9BACT|nr:M3 family oligoendopeptidase [Prosthecobacter dejongeii]MBB5038650.1 oligoendopeptidase F [Prosthecobacter dejongeii]
MSSPIPLTPDRWSLESWFTAFGGADYIAFKADLVRDLEALKQQATALGQDLPAIVQVLTSYEKVGDRLGHLSAYLGCLSADDASDEAVKADEAWISTLDAENTKLRASLQSALAALPEADFERLLKDAALAGAEHAVRRMRTEGRQQMPGELEALAADLNVNGLHAWGRLYDTLSGKMVFDMTFPDGHRETVPMARRRALMSDPDRRLREASFHAGQQPWLDHADTLAAGLNGIAGTRLSLYGHRGIPHFLETPLFDGAMSRASLDAMLEAIHTHIELPRRAIRAAARLQGTPALHYFDLEAPQVKAPDEKPLTWDEACATVDRAFTTAYPALGKYFRDMLQQRWIEAQPRPGKRPGAFCTGSLLRHEERVYMTWHGTVHDMVTLAHEAGHAWHSCVLRPARSYAASYPMTLAETASNFGEMILLDGLMSDPALTPATKAYLLDQEMLRAHAYLVNIPMRYEFEKAFYAERAAGEVSVSRLRELMTAAQNQLYGDTLLPDGTDPMFWASKMHFFITGVSFYNFPYVFGYLLSQALFARFKAEGASFLPRYEAFLAATGSATCEEVARQTLGADLTDPAFWATALQAITPTLEAYEKLPSA